MKCSSTAGRDDDSAFDLTGKTALVTGAAAVSGRPRVALARAGAEVIGASASLSRRRVATRFRSGAFRLPLRLRRPRGRATRSSSSLPAIDILVLNAGTIERRPAVEHGDDIWDRVLEVNLTAPFILARELGRRMVERGSGKIVFVASLLSFQGGVTVPGYAASKGGIAQLTKALANEWAPTGVNVNAIAPGYIATDNTRRFATTRRARADPRAHPRRPLGDAGGPCRRVRLPRFAARPTTCTAPCSRSTAAGSHDERGRPVLRADRACAHARRRRCGARLRAILAGGLTVGRDHLSYRRRRRGDPPRFAIEGLVVGAGTVLRSSSRAALDAGAQFAVAPSTNEEVVAGRAVRRA